MAEEEKPAAVNNVIIPPPQPIVLGAIRRSKSIVEITKALIKFQSQIKLVPKAKANPFFESKYADLGAIWTEIREPLSKNDMVAIHGTKAAGAKIIVTTLILHATGEWLETDVEMRPKNDGAQAVGSTITYGKRYGVSAILNVVSEGEDDDGEGAEGRSAGGTREEKKPARRPAKPAKAAAAKPAAKKKTEWKWSDKAPVWDKAAKKYKCSNCAKHCTTKVNPKTGTYITYCSCGFACDWEAEMPEKESRPAAPAKAPAGGKQ